MPEKFLYKIDYIGFCVKENRLSINQLIKECRINNIDLITQDKNRQFKDQVIRENSQITAYATQIGNYINKIDFRGKAAHFLLKKIDSTNFLFNDQIFSIRRADLAYDTQVPNNIREFFETCIKYAKHNNISIDNRRFSNRPEGLALGNRKTSQAYFRIYEKPDGFLRTELELKRMPKMLNSFFILSSEEYIEALKKIMVEKLSKVVPITEASWLAIELRKINSIKRSA